MKSLTLTIQQIIDIAKFAGLHIENQEIDTNADFIIRKDVDVLQDDGSIYTGLVVFDAEYPEEGAMLIE
ncbi:hypothetical protein KKI90_01560 [Xenorhabdus bovienii]|uniref:hypothetical protein n=1 Tax=Xenorhabdus bovienii TaxID=40576 RepID=UPI00237CF15A|nr:hypothetical protein [Xenorhabdus bovienii]MDE1485140.1 hypothetical protein [Xenorhabdus bovienii]MDE9476003.1 hypothetical protein [Xenorhabdus bovienii]MDE9528772.1 hypothetical protein [Xenorhabdus bovienii]